MELDDDVPLARGDGRCVDAARGNAHWLRADELFGADLCRGVAAGKRSRDLGLERPVHEEAGAQHRGDQEADDQDRHPGAPAPPCGEVCLVRFRDDGPARRDLGFGHFRAADSAIAWTSPCVVYSRATIATGSPSLRAVSAVTGPMQATSASPSTAGNRSSGNARTKLATVDELVNVITSAPSLLKRRIKASPASDGQVARYTGRISTSAPRFASSDGSASRATSARGTSTRMPFISHPSSALANPSAVYSEVISSGRRPCASNDSAVSWPMAHSFEP